MKHKTIQLKGLWGIAIYIQTHDMTYNECLCFFMNQHESVWGFFGVNPP